MKDFNSYSKEDQKKAEEELPEDVADMAKKMAAAFDGKGVGDLLRAIY